MFLLGMQLHYLILALFYVLNAHIFKVTYGADNSSIRLPNTITPDHYKLKVLTHLNDAHGFQYKGDVFIKVNKTDLTINFWSTKLNDRKMFHFVKSS